MNIVFFGTSEFALGALRRLIDSKHRVLVVVTQPDREKGRDLKISPSQTKVLALTRNIPVYQPVDASSRESIGYLKKFNADLFVVAAFGQILKKEALEIPKIYSVNIHGSLLPKYRGAAPTNWAIINDEKTSGVTIIKMNEKMDEGDIMLKKEIAIDPEDTNITLSEKLSDLGADSAVEALGLIESNKVKFVKQDDSIVSYAPKLKKADGLINWDEAAVAIHNKVRGLLPWPGAYTHFNGRILKILKTEVVQDDKASAKNGEVTAIVKNKGMVVKTGKGSLLVKHVQIEGKKAMESEAFLRGHRIELGYIFVVL